MTYAQEHDQRIDHQRHDHHAADQQQQQVGITDQRAKAGGGGGRGDDAENADGRKADDRRHDPGDCGIKIRHQPFGRVAGMLESEPKRDCPGQNADIVRLGHGPHRVVHQLQQDVLHHLGQAFWRGHDFGGARQLKRDREHEAGHHGQQRCHEGADHVQNDHRAHPAPAALLVVGDGRADQNQHQHRRDRLQGADEEVTQYARRHGAFGPYCGK